MTRVFFTVIILFVSLIVSAANVVVRTPGELEDAAKKALPGDTIFLEDQQWKDASVKIQAKGTAQKPVVIMPRTIGKAFFSGQSDLSLSGEYIVLVGFHFKEGYSSRNAVITFRTDENNLANNCRLTQCVIENYSKPGRFDNDNWLVLWGKNNRVDHCTFINKLNTGPLLIAELNDERSQNNFHSVDSNYFKGRPRLGSNGGETIRIGVSRYSLTPSRTQIVHNYFEECNGEVEIVSIKSGHNNISNNTFYECEGGLVLRHGEKNLVNGNVFIGNNKPYTGGVRIVNPGHTVTNNIFKDLSGTGFRSALSIVNGVPNSLINRYFQATDVVISNNTFMHCASVLFGAGKDAERTLSPQRIIFSHNLFVDPIGALYQDDNNDGGVKAINNAISGKKPSALRTGIAETSTRQHRMGNYVFQVSETYGAKADSIKTVDKSKVGAQWYQPGAKNKTTNPSIVKIGTNEAPKLNQIIEQAKPGDIIELTEAGTYKIKEPIIVDRPITIRATSGLTQKPVLVNASYGTLPAFMIIENGGELAVERIAFNGAYESFGNVQNGIKSTNKPMNKTYKLLIDECDFYNYNEGSFAGFKSEKSTFADSVIIKNSLFRNISGTGINMAEEKDDKGIYGVENTIIQNCVFTNLLGPAINVYRGGNDESTTGPSVIIDHCTFNEVENREQGTAVKLLGAQTASVTNCIFNKSGQGGRAIEFREYRWDRIRVDHCNFYQSGRMESFYGKVWGKHIYKHAPEFKNPEAYDFTLKPASLLQNKSSKGKALGAAL